MLGKNFRLCEYERNLNSCARFFIIKLLCVFNIKIDTNHVRGNFVFRAVYFKPCIGCLLIHFFMYLVYSINRYRCYNLTGDNKLFKIFVFKACINCVLQIFNIYCKTISRNINYKLIIRHMINFVLCFYLALLCNGIYKCVHHCIVKCDDNIRNFARFLIFRKSFSYNFFRITADSKLLCCYLAFIHIINLQRKCGICISFVIRISQRLYGFLLGHTAKLHSIDRYLPSFF